MTTMTSNEDRAGGSSRKTRLQPEEITAMLRAELGESIDLHPLSEGLESQAFGFTAKGQEWVVRVNPSDAGFAKDDFAFRYFASPALPIPPVLSITRRDGVFLCVSKRAAGITLQDVDAWRLDLIVQPVASVLDAMAAVDVSMIAGCGPFHVPGSGGSGRGGFADWPAFIGAIADPRHYDWQVVGQRADLTIIHPLLADIEAFAAVCPDRRGLVHGDFGSNNVLTAEDRITGVIDWSEAMVGDPRYDIANILFWRPWLDCMEAQARFFETAQPWRLREGRLLACYQLRIGLENVYQAALAQDAADLAWGLARCQSIAGEVGLAARG